MRMSRHGKRGRWGALGPLRRGVEKDTTQNRLTTAPDCERLFPMESPQGG